VTDTNAAKPRAGSLQRRVTIATVVVFAVVLVAVIVVVVAAFTVITNRSVAAVLTDHVQLAEQLAAQNTAPGELVARLETRSVRARLVLSDGRVFGSLQPRRPFDAGIRVRQLQLANTSGPLAGAALTLEADGRLLTVAGSRLMRLLVVVAAVAIVVVAVGVPMVVRVALSPLDAMTRLARAIAAGRRGQRLGQRNDDTELGRTASAFDEMLDALEGAERRALASEESMRRFVADAAHELRTPVAGIAAATEAVLQQPPDADPRARQRLLLVLGREAQRAGRLIDDLLDLARIDSGLSLHPEPTDLLEVADVQVERARLLHPELVLTVDGRNLTATVDPARIGQVVANLLNNACEVTPAGGKIHVRVDRVGGFVEVSVIDGGPGVAPQDSERIFGRLVRADGAGERRMTGAGLGLPIARGIARAHGGDVFCRPTPKGAVGAVFVLRLPVD
jgi:two-component system, OmpR family, sensor kinase